MKTKADWDHYENPRITARNTATSAYWDKYDPETHACVGCGSRSRSLEVHHIDGNPYNDAMTNLEARCRACHKRVHRREAIHDRLADMRAEAGALGDD